MSKYTKQESEELARTVIQEVFNNNKITAPIVRDLMQSHNKSLIDFWLRVRMWSSDLVKLGINIPNPIDLRLLIYT